MGLFFSPRAISQRNVAPALYWQQYFLCIDLTFGGAVCLKHWFSFPNLPTRLFVEDGVLPRVVWLAMDQL